jgi:hypothetical protein
MIGMAFKGQSGGPMGFERPRTKKQKKDAELRRQRLKKQFKREYIKAYFCRVCNKRLEECFKNSEGTFCYHCKITKQKLNEVVPTKKLKVTQMF